MLLLSPQADECAVSCVVGDEDDEAEQANLRYHPCVHTVQARVHQSAPILRHLAALLQ